jgi:hypothetical protein
MRKIELLKPSLKKLSIKISVSLPSEAYGRQARMPKLC